MVRVLSVHNTFLMKSYNPCSANHLVICCHEHSQYDRCDFATSPSSQDGDET